MVVISFRRKTAAGDEMRDRWTGFYFVFICILRFSSSLFFFLLDGTKWTDGPGFSFVFVFYSFLLVSFSFCWTAQTVQNSWGTSMFRPVLQASKTHPKSFFDIRQENLGPQKHLSVSGGAGAEKEHNPAFLSTGSVMPGGQSHALSRTS